MGPPRKSSSGVCLSARDKLFGVVLGLAVVMIGARALIMQTGTRAMFWQVAESGVEDRWLGAPTPAFLPYLPLAAYQDLAFCAVVSWVSWATLSTLRSKVAQRAVSIVIWSVCLFAAAYAAVNIIVYYLLGTPVTYGLLVLSDHLSLVKDALRYEARPARLLKIAVPPLLVLAISRALYRYAPTLLSRFAAGFHSFRGAAVFLLYFIAGALWTANYPLYYRLFFNPEWRFCASVFDWSAPFASGKFPKQYTEDFLPVGQRSGRVTTTAANREAARRQTNIVMIVMESVGKRYLGSYGAPFPDTPELDRLAANAATFDSVYVAQALSNNAMGALLCSIYPYHGFDPIATRAPRLAIPGLAAVLAARGYRTGVLHTGEFARARSFLSNHGFAEIYDYGSLPGYMHQKPVEEPSLEYRHIPEDQILAPAALKWIDSDRSRPFFLFIWTYDTHYPYAAPTQHDFGIAQIDNYKYLKDTVEAANLNRYLNAIEETDAIIGQIMRGLESRGLADDTIVVVTGDHGEQFRQHGHLLHGTTVYEDEMQVPLLIINRKLFPKPLRIEPLGRQMDIAPTLLGLLGIEPPPQWQGQNLLANHPDRVYLYSNAGAIVFGLVQGNLKYIYNFSQDRAEIYDLKRDPGEQRNLTGDPTYANFASEAHARLIAWVAFQNQYLDQFIDEDKAGKATSLSDAAMPKVMGAGPEGLSMRKEAVPIVPDP